MARPRRDDDKIYLHARRNGNSRYTSSNEAYEKDGTRRYRVIDWGTLDEKDRFLPAKRFLYEHGSKEEESRPGLALGVNHINLWKTQVL